MTVVVSAGEHGAFVFTRGVWHHCPAAPAQVVSTAGAGDALLGGILSGIAAGIPLVPSSPSTGSISERPLESALQMAVLLASFSVTSPHTIHPEANLEGLLQFANRTGVTFSDCVSRFFRER
jgi:sugar/nucleoside kinase (ribokinase family)